MEITEILSKILNLVGDGKIWIIIGTFFVITYLFISLLTWSFLKPLKYVGIPTLIVGVLFLVLRFALGALSGVLPIPDELNIVKTLLPSFLKPVLINGLICFILGIAMIVLYIILNKRKKTVEPTIENANVINEERSEVI